MGNEVDPKLLEAISFFEKMLETMPGDRTGLEFLAVAYEKTGEVEKQVSTLTKLSEVLLKENDLEHASMIVDKLKTFDGYAQAQMAVRVAEMIIAKGGIPTPQSPTSDEHPLFFEADAEPEPPKASLSVNRGSVQAWASDATKAEIELVWQWKDSELLPKDICMDLLHVFMDHPVSDAPARVSALGLLEERHPEYTATAFEDLQKRGKLPAVPLELFDVSADAFSMLPAAYSEVKGVVPFAKMGGECLVGVLNPLNKTMQEEIEKLSGVTCHFYLVHPAIWVSVTEPFFA